MAFITIDPYTAKIIEKGFSTSGYIKAADLRFTSYGPDLKKNSGDEISVGAAAYVQLNDAKDPGGYGTVTRMFFDVHQEEGTDRVAIENIINSPTAVTEAANWVYTQMNMTLSQIAAQYPTA